MRKIGIMGGTFDPIHVGHLIMAQQAQAALGLNQIVFIPSACPPHKLGHNIVNIDYRYRMALLATDDNNDFIVSDIEMKRQGPSYSLDTVRELKAQNPDVDFYFIIGMDSFLDLYKWHCPEELIEECKFIVCKRPGFDPKDASDSLKALIKNHEQQFFFIDSYNIEISSSNIRENIHKGLPFRYMLPKMAYEFIITNNLYGATEGALLMDLKTHLSHNRYEHTLSVAEVAVQLANLYGVDAEKARISALLHDNAKYTRNPSELINWVLPEDCDQYNLSEKDASILHAFAGVKRAIYNFNALVEGQTDIQNAIRFHTTGRPEMTKLEQIVFISDFIDPKRDEFPERSVAYELAFHAGLDETCCYILTQTIEYLKQKGTKIHSLTMDAARYYQQKTNYKE